MRSVLLAVAALAAAAAYFAPSMVAYARAVPGTRRIVLVNLLAGWTIGGWAEAMKMAMRRPPPAGPGRQSSRPDWQARLSRGSLGPPGRPGSAPPLPGHLRMARAGSFPWRTARPGSCARSARPGGRP
jgi:hypothetical protein